MLRTGPDPVTDPKNLWWRQRECVDLQILTGVSEFQSGFRDLSSRGEERPTRDEQYMKEKKKIELK